MSQDPNLDSVIRKVDKNEKAATSQKIVIVDKDKNKILTSKPFFGAGSHYYYLISTTDDSSNVSIYKGLECNVTNFSSGKEIDLIVDYKVRCSAANADKVSLSLCGNDTPIYELNKKLRSFINELAEVRVLRLIDNFAVEEKKLVEDLSKKVKEKIGLEFEAKISRHHSSEIQAYEKEKEAKRRKEITSQLKPFSPPPFQVNVRVTDYDEDLNLHISVVLEVDDENQEAAIDNHGYEDKLATLIRDETKRHFLANVKLQQFLFNLQSDVSQSLTLSLKASLSLKGRKVGYLFLNSESISLIKNRLLLEESLSIEKYPVSCRIKGYDNSITVLNDLQLVLKDAGKYAIAVTSQQIPDISGKPSLNRWIETKLESTIKTLLLSKTYVDVLLGFEEVELDSEVKLSSASYSKRTKSYSSEIRSKLSQDLENIGYFVQHILSVPDLEPFKLKGECEIKTGERDYATKDNNVSVKLDTSVILKIESLEKIKNRLTPNNLLQTQIQEAIHTTISLCLTSIEPERFYLRFYNADIEQSENKSLELELIEKVKEKLEKEFFASVSSVIPKTVDNEIIELVKELLVAKSPFEIQIKALKGGDPVTYQGDFRVSGITKEKWETLQAQLQSWTGTRKSFLKSVSRLQEQISDIAIQDNTETEIEEKDRKIKAIQAKANGIEEIKKAIEKYLGSKLATFVGNQLKYTDLDQRDRIEKVFNSWINDPDEYGSIPNQFGLQIAIYSFERDRTSVEKLAFDARTSLEIQQIEAAKAHGETRAMHLLKRQQELERLYQKRLMLIDGEDNDQEIEELDKKIKKIQDQIGTPSLESMNTALEKIEPQSSGGQGWDVIAERYGLSESTNQNKTSISGSTRKESSKRDDINDEEKEKSTIDIDSEDS
jgi:hypothetical protein